MRDPVGVDYRCPYLASRCIKRGHQLAGPYPVCSIFRRTQTGTKPGAEDLVVVCPKRFFEVDLMNDIINYVWGSPPPRNPRMAYEVRMAGFGTVDAVLADIDERSLSITKFISIEIQAVDITGTVEPAYQALLNRSLLPQRPNYNFNFANVRKRFLEQLVVKGFFHHQWGTKIVAVVQDHLYARIRADVQFPQVSVADANIVFLVYTYQSAGPRYKLVLDRVVGVTHSNLMMGILYRSTPPKEQFCQRIMRQLRLA